MIDDDASLNELSLDSYFAEAGRRAHVIWPTDGAYSGTRERSTAIVNPPGGGAQGIWVEPLRVADGLDFFRLGSGATPAPLERFATLYRRGLDASEIEHHPPLPSPARLTKRVWVPLNEPAIVVERKDRARPGGRDHGGLLRFRPRHAGPLA